MKSKITKLPEYSTVHLFALTLLRVLIGWHFLYEGLVKLFNPVWTSLYYLEGSVGPFSYLYWSLAENDSVIAIVDYINIWGFILVGGSLFVGIFTKPFKILGIVLLLFYYFAYPPFSGLEIQIPMEGNYWIVNKNLIEAATIFVLYLFPSSHITGPDWFFVKPKG